MVPIDLYYNYNQTVHILHLQFYFAYYTMCRYGNCSAQLLWILTDPKTRKADHGVETMLVSALLCICCTFSENRSVTIAHSTTEATLAQQAVLPQNKSAQSEWKDTFPAIVTAKNTNVQIARVRLASYRGKRYAPH